MANPDNVVAFPKGSLNRLFAKARKHLKQTVEEGVALGAVLFEIKGHFEGANADFILAVEKNVGISQTQVYNLLSVYEFSGKFSTSGKIWELPIDFGALIVLARKDTPTEIQEQILQQAANGEHIAKADVQAARAAQGSGGGRGRTRGTATTSQNTAARISTPLGNGRGCDPANPTASRSVASPSPLSSPASTSPIKAHPITFLADVIIGKDEYSAKMTREAAEEIARALGWVPASEAIQEAKASQEALQRAQATIMEERAIIDRQAHEITCLKEELAAKSSPVPPQPASGASLAATPATIYRDFASLDLHARLKAIDLIADQLDNGKDEANRHRMSYCTAFFANIRTEEWRDKVRHRLIPEGWAARQPSSSTTQPVVQNLNHDPSPNREPQDLRRQWAPGEGLKKQTASRKPLPRPNGNGNGGHRNGYGEDGF